MGTRKGRIDRHRGKEKATAREAGPSGCTWGTGINVLNRDALLGATECLHDGVSVEVDHAAGIFYKGVNNDIRPEALNEPGDNRNDKEEARVDPT